MRSLPADQPWVAAADRWYRHDRDVALEAGRTVAAVDPATLDDEALAGHLESVWAFVIEGMRARTSPCTSTTPSRRAFSWSRRRGAADSLDGLRSLGDEVSAALDEFLLLHGWRLLSGYDIDGPCLAESPGLRDDNSSILLSWRVGLARRAWLAAGERLVVRGEVPDRRLALEATAAEVASLLRGRAIVDTVVLRSRADHRRTLRAADAPPVLGPPEAPVPTGVGGALGLVFEVFSLFDVGAASNPEPLRGTGVGDAPYTGTVRLVHGARTEDVEHFNPGDVLVAPMTSPSYNLLLSLVGAVVTEAGGLFSHAAIMARELGLPAVIGAPEAMTLLRDGDVVTIDPAGGTVRRSPS